MVWIGEGACTSWMGCDSARSCASARGCVSVISTSVAVGSEVPFAMGVGSCSVGWSAGLGEGSAILLRVDVDSGRLTRREGGQRS